MRVTLTLLAIFLLPLFALSDELRTLDGKTYTGTIVGVSDKEVSIKTTEGIITQPLGNVIGLDLRAVKGVPGGIDYTDISLIDETLLHCKSFAVKGKDIEMTLLNDQTIKVPLGSVTYILKKANDAKLLKAFNELLAERLKRDRIVTYNADQVNALEGTLGDPDATGEKIYFRPTDGEGFNVALSKVQGLIFYRTDAPAKPPICLVHDVVGNVLAATKVTSVAGKMRIETTIKDVFIELDQIAIARFDYNMGKLTYLSDLVPIKIVERSGVGLIVTHRKDVNLDGEQIVLDRTYGKGLSLHAHTELEYDLKGKYKKFSAILGIDTRVGADSQALVTIDLDGRQIFQQVITAKSVVPIQLDIAKGSTLRIICSSRNLLDLHDHVTIAMAKVTQ